MTDRTKGNERVRIGYCILLIFMLSSAVNTGEGFVSAQNPRTTYTHTIEGGDWWWTTTNYTIYDGLYGDFTIENGTADFYMLTNDSLTDLIHGRGFNSPMWQKNTDGQEFQILVPSTDIWHFFFGNPNASDPAITVTLNLYQDQTAPTFTTDLINETTYEGEVRIQVWAEDDIFEIQSIRLIISGSSRYVEPSTHLDYNWFTFTEPDGETQIEIEVTDEAGNRKHTGYTVTLDNYPPTTPKNTTTPTPSTGQFKWDMLIIPTVLIAIGMIVIGGYKYQQANRPVSRKKRPMKERRV